MEHEPTAIVSVARLVGERRGLIRRLSAFDAARHRVPERHDAASERFIAGLGAELVAECAEDLHRRLREAWRLRRRELTLELVEASASIRCPGCALRVWFEQDPVDPAAWRLPLEVTPLAGGEVLDDPRFHQLFAGQLERIELALPRTVDVLARVDALEDDERFERGLDYDPLGAWLRLTLPHEGLVLHLTPGALSIALIDVDDLPRLIAGGRALAAAVVGPDAGGLLGV